MIASEVGGIPELIDDGVNGILVPNEPEAVAAAFGRIDPALGQAAARDGAGTIHGGADGGSDAGGIQTGA